MPTPTLPTIFRPVFLVDALGEYALLPDGAIVNIGGVVGPNFTVGGRPLLFADGTTTDGGTVSIISPDLQAVYANSVGEAFIDFTAGKDLVFQAINGKQFRFDAETGLVTVTGNLLVLGDSNEVVNSRIDTDRIEIHQSAGNYIPFLMEPASGVTPTVNVVDIKVAQSGASVFTIGPDGSTYIQNLTVGSISGIDLSAITVLQGAVAEHEAEITGLQGLVAGHETEITNLQGLVAGHETEITALQGLVAGIDLSGIPVLQGLVAEHETEITGLQAALTTHLEPTGIKHGADQISANTEGLSPVSGTNVQEVIESINTALGNIISVGSNIKAYEHVQLEASPIWVVMHNQNSKRIQITVWDETDELIFAETIKITDPNTVLITYNTPITGRAILMLF